MPQAALARRIQQELGDSAASGGEEATRTAAISDYAPQAVAFPRDEEQVAHVLALANRERWAVVPWGSGATRTGSRPPSRYDVALMMSGLGAVLDHDAENLTLTAQAGAALAEINRQLRPKHQFLPFGFSHERRTLGGLVSANRTPPQRLQYGDLRDQILGLRVATPDGALVRYGRKVLKNVAGYDMNKLFLGAEGQFGVIVELTLKLAALPDATAYLAGTFAAASDAFASAAALFTSALQPSGLFILNGRAGATFRQGTGLPAADGVTLVAGFEGRGVTVKRQLTDGADRMRKQSARTVETLEEISEAAASALGFSAQPSGSLVLRCGTAPTVLAGLWNAAQQIGGAPNAVALAADYGAGRLLVTVDAPPATPQLGPQIETLRRLVAGERGYVAIQQAPPEVHAAAVARTDTGEALLLQALKARIDPNGIMAPGRAGS